MTIDYTQQWLEGMDSDAAAVQLHERLRKPYPDSFFPSCLDMVRYVSLEAMNIRSSGVGYTKCLWHTEKSASLRVKDFWVKCFGCGAEYTSAQLYCEFAEKIGYIWAISQIQNDSLDALLQEQKVFERFVQIQRELGFSRREH